ncbi:MAG: tetratricopeptide repeat protein [Tahibacter sp.]
MLEDIARLHSEGRLDEAEAAYRVFLADQPEHVDALHLLGVLRRERDDRAEARLLLERARKLDPERCDVLLEIAGLHFFDGDLVGARALLERVVKLDPNVPGAYTLYAQIAALQGDVTQAESLFRTALRLTETDAVALGGLGRILVDTNNVDKALGYLTRAAELAPQDALVQVDLARAFALRGNAAFAEQAASNALRMRPELHAARRVLAQILLQEGRVDEAEAAFSVLSEAPAQRAFALFGLADTARLKGNLETAVERYQAALALQPHQSVAVQMLGTCLAALGRDAEAVEVYTAHLAVHADALAIEALLADQHMQSGRFALAMQAWQAIAQRRPEDAIPFQRMALLCEFMGDNANALLLANRLTDALKQDPDLILLRARAALRESRDADASALLESLRQLGLTPQHVMQAAHLFGLLADRRGDFAQAVPAWSEAQRGLPQVLHEQPMLDVREPQQPRLTPPRAPADGPVFLLGLPGSMVERVAALLAEQPGIALLRDRPFSAQRRDDFSNPGFDHYVDAMDAVDAQQRRDRWAAQIAATGTPADGRIVDWLVRWDARFLPLLQQGFTDATLIVVERDSRDLLLNWLAYGWMPEFALHDAQAAAGWLRLARQHMDSLDKVEGLRIIHVDADALLSDPEGNGADLAHALGIARLGAGSPQLARGGLTPGLPGGRWQAYKDALATAFAELDAPI